jgi:hypothetical protein
LCHSVIRHYVRSIAVQSIPFKVGGLPAGEPSYPRVDFTVRLTVGGVGYNRWAGATISTVPEAHIAAKRWRFKSCR